MYDLHKNRKVEFDQFDIILHHEWNFFICKMPKYVKWRLGKYVCTYKSGIHNQIKSYIKQETNKIGNVGAEKDIF